MASTLLWSQLLLVVLVVLYLLIHVEWPDALPRAPKTPPEPNRCHRWCPCGLRRMQRPDKPETMPSLQHVYEGVVPWCLLLSSLRSR
jgi:hypothetical protein